MNADVLNGHQVVVGICNGCGDKKVLVDYNGDCFCARCIEHDEHLSNMIGWRRC